MIEKTFQPLKETPSFHLETKLNFLAIIFLFQLTETPAHCII